MATRKECDQYAAELNERFEGLVQWAIQNWPHKNFPLLMSDFAASRREIGTILGPKLGDDDGDAESASSEINEHPAYVSTTPMPWP
jgi:hypothetical protein